MHVFHCFLDSCMKSIIYVHINFQILNLVHLYQSLVKVSCDRVVNEKLSFVHLNECMQTEHFPNYDFFPESPEFMARECRNSF